MPFQNPEQIFYYDINYLLFPFVNTAFPAADYHWKFDASSSGFTYESSSQSLNKGLLYPGTKIVPDSNRTGKVAYFNGTNSGIAIDNFQSNCFVYPSTCDKGLSIAFWIKWTKVKAQYLLCSANLTFQDYTGSVLPLSLWNGTHQWRIFSTPGNDATEWHCYAIVWDKHVLYLYIDGKKVHQDIGSHSASGPDGLLPSQMKPRRLTLGNTAKENVIIEDTVGMYMDDLRIRERNISSSDIEEICKDGKFFRTITTFPAFKVTHLSGHAA